AAISKHCLALPPWPDLRRAATRARQRLGGIASRLGRESHDDVKLRGEFAGARGLYLREIHGHGVARFWIPNVSIDAVLFIFRLASDIALGRPFLAALHL